MVTAQSLLQKPQAVLSGLQGKGSQSPSSGQGEVLAPGEELLSSYLHSELGDLPTGSVFEGTVLIWGEEGWVLALDFQLSGVSQVPNWAPTIHTLSMAHKSLETFLYQPGGMNSSISGSLP